MKKTVPSQSLATYNTQNKTDFSDAGEETRAGAPDSEVKTPDLKVTENAPKEDINKILKQFVQKTYTGLDLYIRYIYLPEFIAEKYTQGLIIRDPREIDTSHIIAGMKTSHRFAILSNHMIPLHDLELISRALYIAAPGSRFKVIGQHTHQDKTFIILLHLLDDPDLWRFFAHIKINIDDTLFKDCIQHLSAQCAEPVFPALSDDDWLKRCASPLGINDDAEFFPLEEEP
jgi:hypothetical protein